MANGYWLSQQKINGYKKMWLTKYPYLKDEPGIYVLTRVDENGLRYCYVGQSGGGKQGVLTRLAQHSNGYEQHIDISLKKHKLYNQDTNKYGWCLANVVWCEKDQLDDKEKQLIKYYANLGYQLRNHSLGGQNQERENIIGEGVSNKTYRQGLKQGYENCLKDIKEYFDKYLMFELKGDCYKKDGSIKEIYGRKYKEFSELINKD